MIVILIQLNCYAQFGADFTVVSDIGCDEFIVRVVNQSSAPDSTVIVYNFGDGTGETNDTFHIYPSPGRYRIVQTVANGNPRQDSVFVEVIEPLPPQFILSNCKGTEGFVYLDDTLYNAYQIDWGDGNTEIAAPYDLISHDYGSINTYSVSVKGLMDPGVAPNDLANLNCNTSNQTITLINDIQTGIIDRIEVFNEDSLVLNYSLNPGTSYYLEMNTNNGPFDIIDTISQVINPDQIFVGELDTESNYYCFRVVAFDPCDGETRPSLTACSVALNGSALNNQNELIWETFSADLYSYEVFRDNAFYQNVGSGLQYADIDVICGVDYCYRITMEENNGFESLSNTICLEAISSDTPPSVGDVYASVENGLITLNWNDPFPIPDSYQIEISDNDGLINTITTDTSFYTDTSHDPATGQYFYTVSYINRCDNESYPATASPVFLSKGLNNALTWTNYIGFANGVSSYTLEKYNIQGELLANENLGLDTSYFEMDFNDLPQRITYRILIMPADSTQGVFSNFVDIVFPSNVFFPNAFTPNGDGLNDIFNFEGNYISEYRLVIFNRWGEVVFQTDNVETGWDGTIGSRLAPGGMYIFNAEFKDDIGIEFVKKGEIYLIR